jgi:hypothetical protein
MFRTEQRKSVCDKGEMEKSYYALAAILMLYMEMLTLPTHEKAFWKRSRKIQEQIQHLWIIRRAQPRNRIPSFYSLEAIRTTAGIRPIGDII